MRHRIRIPWTDTGPKLALIEPYPAICWPDLAHMWWYCAVTQLNAPTLTTWLCSKSKYDIFCKIMTTWRQTQTAACRLPSQRGLCIVSVKGGSWRFHTSGPHMTSHWKTIKHTWEIFQKFIQFFLHNMIEMSVYCTLKQISNRTTTISMFDLRTLCDLSPPYLFYTPFLMVVLRISGYEIVQFLWNGHTDEDRKAIKNKTTILRIYFDNSK